MKNIVRVFIAVVLLTSIKSHAQEFAGVATYKSKRKLDVELDSAQVSPEIHQKMMDMLKKQFEKTYKLTFNKEESVYKEEESLGAPQPAGMDVIMVSADGADILYKNIKEKRYTNQNDVFGKRFLIKDKLEDAKWEFGSETKNIGEYTCYKATMKLQHPKVGSSISIYENGDKEGEAEMGTKIITAWYTPQIPVSNGPGEYYGLPGLILEVNDGSETVICSKIVLNAKSKIKIAEPTKGKEVTKETFDEILEKKLEEMKERAGKGAGQQIEIKIGG